MALRLGLQVADAVARSLPRGAAYALADLGGRAWYRLAAERRALVAENMSAWRPPPAAHIGRAMRRMVQRLREPRAVLAGDVSLVLPREDIPEIISMSTTGSAGSRCCAAGP